ncbi:MAG: HisA/HisF-related TIM barrel protein [Pirellulaceae bacterium]
MSRSELPPIVPVLDIQAGRVVRGVGGERRLYRSVLEMKPRGLEQDDPLSVATWYRSRFGASRLYVADLDALSGTALRRRELLHELIEAGFHLVVDAAWGSTTTLPTSNERLDGLTPILGTETWRSPDRLADLGRERLPGGMLSLDLHGAHLLARAKRGGPRDRGGLGRDHAKASEDSAAIVPPTRLITACRRWLDVARSIGITDVLLLDLASVGRASGLSTLSLLSELKPNYPDMRWWLGGGIRGPADGDSPLKREPIPCWWPRALLDGSWPARNDVLIRFRWLAIHTPEVEGRCPIVLLEHRHEKRHSAEPSACLEWLLSGAEIVRLRRGLRRHPLGPC